MLRVLRKTKGVRVSTKTLLKSWAWRRLKIVHFFTLLSTWLVCSLVRTYLIYYDAPIKPIDTVVCSYFPVEISVGMNKLLDIELHMSVCVCCTLEYYSKFVYSYKYRNYIYMFRQYGL